MLYSFILLISAIMLMNNYGVGFASVTISTVLLLQSVFTYRSLYQITVKGMSFKVGDFETDRLLNWLVYTFSIVIVAKIGYIWIVLICVVPWLFSGYTHFNSIFQKYRKE